jgi:hypothetical protein
MARFRRMKPLENERRTSAAAGARRQLARAQQQSLRHWESGSDVYAPAPLEKLATASASVL